MARTKGTTVSQNNDIPTQGTAAITADKQNDVNIKTTPPEENTAAQGIAVEKENNSAVNTTIVYKEFAATDLIPCKSITQGELILTGIKSGITYRWFEIGEVIQIEFQDLNALNAKNSKFLHEPLFVIENEELLQLPRWEKIKKRYDNLNDIGGNMDDILKLAPAQLKQALIKLPKSYTKALAIEVATRIDNDSYDSIKRIKVFDEVLGTDLLCLIK